MAYRAPLLFGNPVVVWWREVETTMLPKPPTDSLYKFAGVLGLILVVVPIYTWLTKLDDFDLAWEEAIRAGTEAQTAMIVHLSERMKETPGLMPHSSDTKEEADAKVARFEQMLQRFHLDVIEEMAVLERAQKATARLMVAQRGAKRWIWAACVAGVVGGLLCYWGVSRWHRRLQRPQDALLERQVADPSERASGET